MSFRRGRLAASVPDSVATALSTNASHHQAGTYADDVVEKRADEDGRALFLTGTWVARTGNPSHSRRQPWNPSQQADLRTNVDDDDVMSRYSCHLTVVLSRANGFPICQASGKTGRLREVSPDSHVCKSRPGQSTQQEERYGNQRQTRSDVIVLHDYFGMNHSRSWASSRPRSMHSPLSRRPHSPKASENASLTY